MTNWRKIRWTADLELLREIGDPDDISGECPEELEGVVVNRRGM
jgi:hypothetical protein